MKTENTKIKEILEQNFFSEKENRAFLDPALNLKKLQYLAIHFDPFLKLEEQREQNLEAIIEEFGLDLYLQDPFLLTNHLLKLIDCLEEDLKTVKH